MMNFIWQNMEIRYFLNNLNMEEKNKENLEMTASKVNDEGKKQEKKVTITLHEYEILRTENVKSRDLIYNLRQQINEYGEALAEKRISYLLGVLEHAIHFDDEFVAYCANEIKEALYVNNTASNDEVKQ